MASRWIGAKMTRWTSESTSSPSACTTSRAARKFYVEGLGWDIALEVPGDILFVQVNHGLLLAFYGADDLAADVAPGAPARPVSAPPPMSLAQVVGDEDEVVAVCERARDAGATVLKEPQAADFGGFHCYFADPSGFHWEVSTNPGWQVGSDGRVTDLPDRGLTDAQRSAGTRCTVPSMTVKLVVLYTQPDDVEAFDRHYLGVHGPLVDKIPGLVRWESARLVSVTGPRRYDVSPDGGALLRGRAALGAALAPMKAKRPARLRADRPRRLADVCRRLRRLTSAASSRLA